MEVKNDGRLKICWMRLIGYQQFQDVFLDFTHPQTGEPLDKICFIGANGTGKTILLEKLKGTLSSWEQSNSTFAPRDSLVVTKLQFEAWSIFIWQTGGLQGMTKSEELIQAFTNYFMRLPEAMGTDELTKLAWDIGKVESDANAYAPERVVFLTAESERNLSIQIGKTPETSSGAAMKDDTYKQRVQVVSQESIIQFWNLAIRHYNERIQYWLDFQHSPENRHRPITIDQLEREFEERYPRFFDLLTSLWNRILEPGGLRFSLEDDMSSFRTLQPDENLNAKISLSRTGQQLAFGELSTGIRNFLFRVGHVASIFFESVANRGFLFVDEPENGLFPDFLYELISVYQEAVGEVSVLPGQARTQMFFATHEPIIAAQFEPYERIILEWNDNGSVRTRRGTSPIGDDPNDVLKQDFGVHSLMGAPGKEAFARYRKLKSQLKTESDPIIKEAITTEYLELGRRYNFPA